MQRFLETSPSEIDPCKLWRHWGAGWLSFILLILGLVRGQFNLLPGEASSESMGLPIPVEGLERDKAILSQSGFVEFRR
jgi:hypothetical protein